MTAQKDFATLLRAVALLDAVRLVVLGEGPLRSQLEGLARDLGVADRVALPGFTANPSRLRAADATPPDGRGCRPCWSRPLRWASPWSPPTARAARPRSWPAAAGADWVLSGDPEALAAGLRITLTEGRRPVDPEALAPFRLDTVSARWAELLVGVASGRDRPVART